MGASDRQYVVQTRDVMLSGQIYKRGSIVRESEVPAAWRLAQAGILRLVPDGELEPSHEEIETAADAP